MNGLILALSIMSGIVLCATALSLFVAYRAHHLLAEIDARAHQAREQKDVQLRELNPLREAVDALASQVRDLQSHPQAAAQAGVPKAGFNLSKRSQALRMHRRGEPPEQIATTLDLPRQEVELLLKVHRIVIQNV
jgi:hypothetical protein